MNNDKKFLIATDLESVTILKKMGFKLISEDNDKFIFLNNKTIMFQKLNGVVATDIMCF